MASSRTVAGELAGLTGSARRQLIMRLAGQHCNENGNFSTWNDMQAYLQARLPTDAFVGAVEAPEQEESPATAGLVDCPQWYLLLAAFMRHGQPALSTRARRFLLHKLVTGCDRHTASLWLGFGDIDRRLLFSALLAEWDELRRHVHGFGLTSRGIHLWYRSLGEILREQARRFGDPAQPSRTVVPLVPLDETAATPRAEVVVEEERDAVAAEFRLGLDVELGARIRRVRAEDGDGAAAADVDEDEASEQFKRMKRSALWLYKTSRDVRAFGPASGRQMLNTAALQCVAIAQSLVPVVLKDKKARRGLVAVSELLLGAVETRDPRYNPFRLGVGGVSTEVELLRRASDVDRLELGLDTQTAAQRTLALALDALRSALRKADPEMVAWSPRLALLER